MFYILLSKIPNEGMKGSGLKVFLVYTNVNSQVQLSAFWKPLTCPSWVLMIHFSGSKERWSVSKGKDIHILLEICELEHWFY